VDILKIDGRYVDSTGGVDDVSLLSSIVRLAQSLRLETVAEGVETHEQQLLVQRVESTYAQGFFYSRPLSTADLRRALRTVWLDGDGAGRAAPRRLRAGNVAAVPGEPVA
jgi:EAL domain-containing protein (putative c-di-GMP-specific phosphodiesterase class I)